MKLQNINGDSDSSSDLGENDEIAMESDSSSSSEVREKPVLKNLRGKESQQRKST